MRQGSYNFGFSARRIGVNPCLEDYASPGVCRGVVGVPIANSAGIGWKASSCLIISAIPGHNPGKGASKRNAKYGQKCYCYPFYAARLFPRKDRDVAASMKGLKRWDEGRWGIGNRPQYSRVYTRIL